MNQSARKFQAVLRACQPSTPPVSPSVRLCLTLGPRQQQAVENPPTHPPSFPSFLTLQCGSCKHTSLHSLLLLSPTHTHTTKKESPRQITAGKDFGLLRTPQWVRVPSIYPPAWMWDYERGEGGWGRSALLL